MKRLYDEVLFWIGILAFGVSGMVYSALKTVVQPWLAMWVILIVAMVAAWLLLCVRAALMAYSKPEPQSAAVSEYPRSVAA